MRRPRLKQYEWYDYLVTQKDKLRDPAWVEWLIAPNCQIRRMGWIGRRPQLIQFPQEFAALLVLMAQYETKSYLEIGTSRGGAFMFADSYLRAAVEGYDHAEGVDPCFKLRNWDLYTARFPETKFHHMNSSEYDPGETQFGAVFIDARHIDRWVMRDFGKVKNNARLVAFHDIVLQGASVGPAWARIKRMHTKTWEFIDTRAPEYARCGIGVVDRASQVPIGGHGQATGSMQPS